MQKKYLLLIVFAGLFLLLLYLQKNDGPHLPYTPGADKTLPTYKNETFRRDFHKIVYSKHARCRMACRHIDESEVAEILQIGTLNTIRIGEDGRGKTYPLEGKTHDNQHVRIVFAPKIDEVVVVTVIDLGHDWACDCNGR